MAVGAPMTLPMMATPKINTNNNTKKIKNAITIFDVRYFTCGVASITRLY